MSDQQLIKSQKRLWIEQKWLEQAGLTDLVQIIITEGEIRILSPQNNPQPGLHRGAIWTSEDFDEPLSDNFWLG